jgi:hypothetical protein
MLLVFGVVGVPNTATSLRLTVVRPTGRQHTREILLETGETGLAEIRASIAPLQGDEVGELRAEFRFGGATEASYVATLEILDELAAPVAKPPPGSARLH